MTFPEVSQRVRRRVVWIAPVVVAAVVALIAAMTVSSSASTPKLKPMTAKQLIVAVQHSRVAAFSGTINETTDLGLPSLPGVAQQASLSWTDFLTGSHDFRVWADGPQKQRLALIGELSEAEVVHNGADVWTYTSHTNSVSHTVLPAAGKQADKHADTKDAEKHSSAPETALTPPAIADKLLSAINPSTVVRVATAQTVADRPAYTLSLAPRDSRSTIRKVEIAIDAAKFVPLRVQVFGRASSPALSVGFSKVSFARPSASVFAFHTPKGATVESNPLTTTRHHDGHRSDKQSESESRRPAATRPGGKTSVIGSGWTSVLETSGLAGVGGGMLQDATTSIGGGARLLHTALLNVVLLPDGRAFVGAVTPSVLEHIAATTPR